MCETQSISIIAVTEPRPVSSSARNGTFIQGSLGFPLAGTIPAPFGPHTLFLAHCLDTERPLCEARLFVGRIGAGGNDACDGHVLVPSGGAVASEVCQSLATARGGGAAGS